MILSIGLQMQHLLTDISLKNSQNLQREFSQSTTSKVSSCYSMASIMDMFGISAIQNIQHFVDYMV